MGGRWANQSRLYKYKDLAPAHSALRDPIVNLAAWLFIIWKRPVGVGDRVQIGSASGDATMMSFE